MAIVVCFSVGCFSSSNPTTMAATNDPYGLCPPVDAGLTMPGTGNSETPPSCDAPPPASPLVGWASVPGMGNGTVSVDTTTGGDPTAPITVTALADLNTALAGTTPAVVQIVGITITGNVRIGSNKTLVGICGGQVKGNIKISGSYNVIVRNLKIVGYDCMDAAAVNAKDCSAGADAVTVSNSHHVWFDHDDISDGSDGNLDINLASDFITLSWTKFHYSALRVDPAGAAGGHEFSDLIGSSDNSTTDQGHLRVTWHHDWWGANVHERMPRARFGEIHLFDNLWTSVSNSYCVGLGVGASILAENNTFRGVNEPLNITSYADATSVLEARGNLFEGTMGNTAGVGGAAFVPPYDYTVEDPCVAAAEIIAQSGPQ
jgi:pectate lyase